MTAVVTVRYIVSDVDAAIAFYTKLLGFDVEQQGVLRHRLRRVFDEGYHATLAAAINRRHGSGAFEAVFVESRQQSEEALADARQAWLEQHPEA